MEEAQSEENRRNQFSRARMAELVVDTAVVWPWALVWAGGLRHRPADINRKALPSFIGLE